MMPSFFLAGRGWELTGLAIRQFLIDHGDVSPWDFYVALKEKRKAVGNMTPSYDHIRKYFWILKQMGMIAKSREIPSRFVGNVKAFYRMAPGMETDPRWFHPQRELYPSTFSGSKRYRKHITEGRVRAGRNPNY